MKTGSKFTALAFPLFAVLSATALQAQDGRVEGCRDSVRPAFVQPGDHYENRTRFNASDRRGDFEVVGVVTSACDTAWGVTSEPFPVPSGVRAFSLEFSIRASMDWYVVDAWKRWESLVEWLDGKGDIIGTTPFRPRFIRDAFAFFRIRGEIPAAARSGRVRFGTNAPNVGPGEKVAVRGTLVSFYTDLRHVPEGHLADAEPPVVRNDFDSPTECPDGPVRFRFEDAGGIDWSSVRVFRPEIGSEVKFAREDNGIRLLGIYPLAKGITRFRIEVSDMTGNATVAERLVCIGRKSVTYPVRLRDDGTVLVAGKPFFPIGLYGVDPREFNGFDIDRAFADLAKAGVNLAQSYNPASYNSEKWIKSAARHGIRLFVNGMLPPHLKTIAGSGRGYPHIIAWYLADDTASHVTPMQLLDRHENVNALDGTRLTCHADILFPHEHDFKVSRFSRYVDFADVFMPEIYPVKGGDKDRECVAVTIRDMRRTMEDIRRFGDGAPRSVWPIIQEFRGFSPNWKRFPTEAELNAMVFASIVHGANGLVLYTYGGYEQKDKSKSGYGVTATPEVWCATTNMTRRVADLSPVLLEPTPHQPPVPEIVSGPKLDPLGGPSVTMLLKRRAGHVYVIAVNASPDRVVARLAVPGAAETGTVFWKKRTVSLKDGMLTDAFDGFGVHVYRFREKIGN